MRSTKQDQVFIVAKAKAEAEDRQRRCRDANERLGCKRRVYSRPVEDRASLHRLSEEGKREAGELAGRNCSIHSSAGEVGRKIVEAAGRTAAVEEAGRRESAAAGRGEREVDRRIVGLRRTSPEVDREERHTAAEIRREEPRKENEEELYTNTKESRPTRSAMPDRVRAKT
jgi:hypothetical protein